MINKIKKGRHPSGLFELLLILLTFVRCVTSYDTMDKKGILTGIKKVMIVFLQAFPVDQVQYPGIYIDIKLPGKQFTVPTLVYDLFKVRFLQEQGRTGIL